jgi:hypothetical protein
MYLKADLGDGSSYCGEGRDDRAWGNGILIDHASPFFPELGEQKMDRDPRKKGLDGQKRGMVSVLWKISRNLLSCVTHETRASYVHRAAS